MTTEQIRIRLTTDELKELKNLADRCGISVTSLSAVFVKSGLRAVAENGGRLVLPLKLKVEDQKPRK